MKMEFDPNLHYVYFIREANSHYIKIGYSNDPAKRLGELQIGNPHDMEIFAVLQLTDRDVARRIEAVYHERYKAALIRGEWYVLSDGDLADVKMAVEIANESAKAERNKWHRVISGMASKFRANGGSVVDALRQ